MSPARKRTMFDLLVRMGYKEIEVGFPSASQTDFDFVREPDRGRPDPRRRADLRAHPGPRRADRAHRAVPRRRAARHRAHVQRDRAGVPPGGVRQRPGGDQGPGRRGHPVGDEVRRAVPRRTATSATSTRPRSSWTPSWTSPPRSATAVMDVWQPGPGREIILNLPCTVERSTPNVYADQIEWMTRNLPHREHVCLSVHTHNDRGHRRRRRRAGRAGRRGPDRGLPVRQRRADRERLPGHPGPEPVQPGHRPDDRLLRHRRDPAHRRVLQPASGAPPAPVRG